MLHQNFLGGGGCKTRNLLWEEYGYFLALHNTNFICYKNVLSYQGTLFHINLKKYFSDYTLSGLTNTQVSSKLLYIKGML